MTEHQAVMESGRLAALVNKAGRYAIIIEGDYERARKDQLC